MWEDPVPYMERWLRPEDIPQCHGIQRIERPHYCSKTRPLLQQRSFSTVWSNRGLFVVKSIVQSFEHRDIVGSLWDGLPCLPVLGLRQAFDQHFGGAL